MRRLIRPEIPRILREKQREWTEKFEASGGKRPDASKYGHAEIKRALRSMSANKCSYCEGAITESEGNVEHRLGVTPRGESLRVDEPLLGVQGLQQREEGAHSRTHFHGDRPCE